MARAPHLLSHEEMTFLEVNLLLPRYSAPALSYAEQSFWEVNTMLHKAEYGPDPYIWGVTARPCAEVCGSGEREKTLIGRDSQLFP